VSRRSGEDGGFDGDDDDDSDDGGGTVGTMSSDSEDTDVDELRALQRAVNCDQTALDDYAYDVLRDTDAILNTEAVATASVENQVLRLNKKQFIKTVADHISDQDTLAQIIQFKARHFEHLRTVAQIVMLVVSFVSSGISGASAETSKFRMDVTLANLSSSSPRDISLDDVFLTVTEAEQEYVANMSVMLLSLTIAGVIALMELQRWVSKSSTLSSVYNAAVMSKSALTNIIMEASMAETQAELDAIKLSFKTREYKLLRTVREDMDKWCDMADIAKHLPTVLKNTRDTQQKLVEFRREIRRLRREEHVLQQNQRRCSVIATAAEHRSSASAEARASEEQHSGAESEAHGAELAQWERDVERGS
jgi:hypothetical protein